MRRESCVAQHYRHDELLDAYSRMLSCTGSPQADGVHFWLGFRAKREAVYMALFRMYDGEIYSTSLCGA